MKSIFAALLGAVILSVGFLSVTTPASALGGCGPNGHRERGVCVFGGQNQDFCIRTKGHPAVRMPNGTYKCI